MENNQHNESKKFIVNGVEYNSIDEVPEEFKNLVFGVDKNLKDIKIDSKVVNFKYKINGKEYNSIEELPENLRKFVEDKNQNGIPDFLENINLFGINKIFNFKISKDIKLNKNVTPTNLINNTKLPANDLFDRPSEVADNKYKFIIFVIAIIIIVFFYLAR